MCQNLVNLTKQKHNCVIGGELRADPRFQGFLQTDREGNPRGIVGLDPRGLLQ
jgi:hypothetical protein